MKRLSACLLTLFLISCSDADQVSLPPQAALSTDNLTFLRFSSAAFDAADKTASFWAVRGQARSMVLRYSDDGAEFMRFEVGANTLQGGDSVLISVAVDRDRAYTFHFSPSGLLFNPKAPARLRVNYERADTDVDGNGYVDLSDTVNLITASIWKRELPGLPWLSLPSVNVAHRVLETDVYDFTSFGMAVD